MLAMQFWWMVRCACQAGWFTPKGSMLVFLNIIRRDPYARFHVSLCVLTSDLGWPTHRKRGNLIKDAHVRQTVVEAAAWCKQAPWTLHSNTVLGGRMHSPSRHMPPDIWPDKAIAAATEYAEARRPVLLNSGARLLCSTHFTGPLGVGGICFWGLWSRSSLHIVSTR